MENREVRLIDAPVGLLMYKKCMLMKTEYGSYYDGVFSPDCYIVESGEVFVGGTDNAEYRNNLIVTPIDPASLRPHGEWIDEGTYVTTAYGTLRVCRCSWCRCEITIDDYDNYCPNCGAVMQGVKDE